MVRRARGIFLSALALLLVPSATAAFGEGTFTIEDSIVLPEDTGANAEPLALYVRDTANATEFHASIPEGTVFLVQKRFFVVETGVAPTVRFVTDTDVRSWPVENATVMLAAGEHTGFLGIYPQPEDGLHFTADSHTTAEVRGFSSLGSHEWVTNEDPRTIGYNQRVTVPHLLVSSSGTFTYGGSGAIKFQGLDVEIRSERNTTLHQTGVAQTAPGEVTETWLYLRFDVPSTATLHHAPFEFAAAEIEAMSDGFLRFRPIEGAFWTDQGSYTARTPYVFLDGQFITNVLPLDTTQAHLALVGDLRITSMPYTRSPGFLESAGSFPYVLFLTAVTIVALVGGGVAGTVVVRRKRPLPAAHSITPVSPPVAPGMAETFDGEAPFSAEDCLDSAEKCFGRSDFARALLWLQRARRLAPTSARVAFDEATALLHIGDREGALKAFEEAYNLGGVEPEDMVAAVGTLEEAGVDVETLELWLSRALDQKPNLVNLVEREFPFLLHRSTWKSVAERARRRAGKA